MSKFGPHTAETAPEASHDGLAGAKGKFGFVPNLFGVLAESPATLDGYLALNDIFERSSFSPQEQQLLLLTISVVNGCTDCVPAYSTVAKTVGLSDAVIGAIRDGKPVPDARLAALHGLAAAVVEKRGRVVARQAQSQATQGRDISTLAPLRALRARPSDPAWARRAVGEGVRSCPRAGCGKSARPVR